MPYKNTALAVAQRQHASEAYLTTKEGRKGFWRAIFSCWLGTTIEYADFALYGLAAGIIFGDVFFPEMTPAVALFASFATYSVGFIARPIGALVFGWLGDRKGRKIVMIMTVILMSVSTTLIGLIPSYAHIGAWAPACLVMLRFIQGLGAGAALSGGTVILGEFAPPARRGLVSSAIALGSNSGTLLASLVWLLVLTMDKESLLDWGWRIPFLSSAIIAIVALYIRRYMSETPVFERYKEMLAEQRLQALTENEKRHTDDERRSFWQRTKAFWIMMGLRIGENGPSYLAQGFMIGYVANVLMLDKFTPTIAVFIASILGFLIIPLAGYLSDRFGRRIIYRWFCLLLILYAFPAFILLDSREPMIVIPTIVIGMGLASLGIFGAQAAWGVELFGVANRYTKMALAKELGAVLSGGTAPLIASALFSFAGHWWPIACYFALMASIGFITTFFAPETRGRDLNLLEDAI
ncbi:MHS family MFS transporter [Xenorhabdus nematophila]|uniref:Transport protein (MFS family) n=1 Tax=Xenorhabdus nematophila (strain ATCC 19061 / DSM 3370 / CCUG 14189 / LMG 1036 / NCIMB 9965 / AN6) TaxID=406817 RepID=D3VI15_XENNA|nr:MFS transporter [Xenorhabdus nematophila]CEE90172.1 putative transport protein (MFS family) [Xenorhabdus nematophila str. Anatoliense]CEF31602.1 putative transport protein (MFS family) [Xenorhabdus nematophila str. Websteri]AYA41373.1 MFS transporter [Xenorhabdus nematophila]KHD29772.1 MFS transporter [Xenorhabdus nematophila]MBA0020110.1 MHS family MFS transporter [Xenorhabdus nematophila]